MKKLIFLLVSLAVMQLGAWQVTVRNQSTKPLSVARISMFPDAATSDKRIVRPRGETTFENINRYAVASPGKRSPLQKNLIGSAIAMWGKCESSEDPTNRIIFSKFYLQPRAFDHIAGPRSLQPEDIYMPREAGGILTVEDDPARECGITISKGIPPVPGQITVNAPPQMI